MLLFKWLQLKAAAKVLDKTSHELEKASSKGKPRRLYHAQRKFKAPPPKKKKKTRQKQQQQQNNHNHPTDEVMLEEYWSNHYMKTAYI